MRRKRRRRRLRIFKISLLLLLLAVLFFIGKKLFFPTYYSNRDFGIENIVSVNDADGDGIDDQTDFLKGVRDYIKTKPEYKSVYYDTGYSNDQYGVCTDVIANGYLAAGYDIMTLVNEDILENRSAYDISKPDEKIDFRRVRNLDVYLQHTAQTLTTDIYAIDQWQGGDIVVFEKHIGVVSDRRNEKGIPFVIHHGSPNQASYEQDILEMHIDEIIGHYRLY